MELVMRRWGHGATLALRIPSFWRQVATFNVVMVLWLPFRSDSTAELGTAVHQILSAPSLQTGTAEEMLHLVHGNGGLLIAILAVLTAALILDSRNAIERFIQRPLSHRATTGELLIWDAILILLLLMGDLGGSQFVYFRF